MTLTSVLPVSSIRDLTLLDIGHGRVLVIACDSVGSIGPKPHDSFPASSAMTAHYALRVPLLELLAAGATPEVIVDTLSVEMDPTGAEMIAEIRRVAGTIGLAPERVTGSTEDNVPSVATGIGVTVIGVADRDGLRSGTSQAADVVLCLGAPTSAPQDEVVMDDQRMISFETLAAVLDVSGVRDALPVGSRGIGYEAQQLASSAGLTFVRTDHPVGDPGFDLAKSGGPASCVLVSVSVNALDAIQAVLPATLPHAVIGTFE